MVMHESTMEIRLTDTVGPSQPELVENGDDNDAV